MPPAQTRQITGPIETPEGEFVETGYLRVDLLYPIVDCDALVVPFKIEYTITDGGIPVDAKVAVPGYYEFRIFDIVRDHVWGFKVWVYPNGGSAISMAELFLISKLQDGSLVPEPIQPCAIDASIFGSGDALDGMVLTATGDCCTEWRFPSVPVAVGEVHIQTSLIYTVTTATYIIVETPNNATVIMPPAVDNVGREIEVKKVSDDGLLVTIQAEPGETVEGQPQYNLVHKLDAVTLVSRGDGWVIF